MEGIAGGGLQHDQGKGAGPSLVRMSWYVPRGCLKDSETPATLKRKLQEGKNHGVLHSSLCTQQPVVA